jgi:hypothetical protein
MAHARRGWSIATHLPAFVWDAARGEAVLFGGRQVLFGREGQQDTCLSDTWVLRNDGWHRIAGLVRLPVRKPASPTTATDV